MKKTEVLLLALAAAGVAGGVFFWQRKAPASSPVAQPQALPLGAVGNVEVLPVLVGGQPTQAVMVGDVAAPTNPNATIASNSAVSANFATNPVNDAATIVAQQAAIAAAQQAEQARQAAIVQAALEQQAAQQAAQRRADDIARLRMTAAAVENDQVIVLTQIKSITDSQAGLQDFINQAFQKLWNTQEARDAVKKCNADQFAACDRQWWGHIFHQQLTNDNCPRTQRYCEQEEADYNRKNPASVFWTIAKDPADVRSGYALFEADKAVRRMPLEAELLRLETQFQGIRSQLAQQYSIILDDSGEVHTYSTPKPTPRTGARAYAAVVVPQDISPLSQEVQMYTQPVNSLAR